MTEPLRVLDLFSGIGGFSLGLEAAGIETVAFCEVSPVCRHLLAHHWPKVPCYDDIRTLTAERLAADGITVNAICGGFPCQDLSYAGKGAGLAGERSGLWFEYARLIRELRPDVVVVENVAALLSRGLGVVLGDLAALGYDAEWDSIRAHDVGAPHLRDRLWIVAYARGEQHEGFSDAFRRALAAQLLEAALANTSDRGYRPDDALGDDPGAAGEDYSQGHQRQRVRAVIGRGRAALADADDVRQLQPQGRQRDQRGRFSNRREDVAHTERVGCEQVEQRTVVRSDSEGSSNPTEQSGFPWGRGWWFTEPDVGRVADGVPARVDRLHGLGNAVVPQIPEILGRAILAAMSACSLCGQRSVAWGDCPTCGGLVAA